MVLAVLKRAEVFEVASGARSTKVKGPKVRM
jgi:hypothetical protein